MDSLKHAASGNLNALYLLNKTIVIKEFFNNVFSLNAAEVYQDESTPPPKEHLGILRLRNESI